MNDFKRDSSELNLCSDIKAGLTLIVVFYHSIVFYSGNWFTKDPPIVNNAISDFASWLNSFHIYAFTLISGYLFFYTAFEREKNSIRGGIRLFLVRKIKRLIVPYYFVMLIWVLPVQLCFFKYNFFEIASKYILGSNPNQLWFLWMIFWQNLIFYYIGPHIKENNAVGLFISIGLFFMGYLFNSFMPNYFQIVKSTLFVPFFYLGFLLRKYSGSRKENTENIFGVAAMAINVFLFAILKNVTNRYLFLLVEFVCHLSGAYGGFIIIGKIIRHIRDQKIASHLREKSMGIYLFHQQLVYFAIKIIPYLSNPYLNSICNFAISLCGSYFILFILYKWRPTRILLGEKS